MEIYYTYVMCKKFLCGNKFHKNICFRKIKNIPINWVFLKLKNKNRLKC